MPNLEHAREGQRGQRERQHHGQGLREEHQAVALDPVNQCSREGRDEQTGNLPGEGDDAQPDRRPGQAINEPGNRHLLHPGAEDRNPLPEEIEAEVAMSQARNEVVGNMGPLIPWETGRVKRETALL